MSAALKQAAQAVLDRWDSPQWEWAKHGPTAGLMADLRKAIEAEPQQEPVAWVDERAIGWLEGRGKTASITTQLQTYKSPERPMPLYATPQQAQPEKPLGAPIAPEHEAELAQLSVNAEALHREYLRGLKDGAQQAQAPGWMPIEAAPKDGRTLLLGRFNSHKKWRTMRGQWMSADYIAENWEEPDDAEPGWYETCVEKDDAPNCWSIEPTHYMPLPPAPQGDKP